MISEPVPGRSSFGRPNRSTRLGRMTCSASSHRRFDYDSGLDGCLCAAATAGIGQAATKRVNSVRDRDQ